MTESQEDGAPSNVGEVALIVGGGPGVSASCARLFASVGMKVAVAARDPDKPVLKTLASDHGVSCYGCDASQPDSVSDLFARVSADLGAPRLVVHNIDGRTMDIFRKEITEVDPKLVLNTLHNSTYSAFLVAQQAAIGMMANTPEEDTHRGTIIFTNASAAYKGYPKSGAFAMSCHGKTGLAQSMARELMPQGIHIAHAPIDTAIGWTQEDGSRWHRRAGTTENDNMADPARIAEMYLHLHRQHRSTWTFETVMRPWLENW
ncbi:MAG: SDR family oxidoreductase [Gammaproteobacteria bacterium]